MVHVGRKARNVFVNCVKYFAMGCQVVMNKPEKTWDESLRMDSETKGLKKYVVYSHVSQ